MKNGQSAPINAAISSNLSAGIRNWQKSLTNFNMNAASADPPPSPAPKGMAFNKATFNLGTG